VRQQFHVTRLGQQARHQHRHRPLGEVEQEHRHAPALAQQPADVGRADVAAALRQHVHAAPAADQVAERHGP
jgi:hypothetical protein